MAEEFEQFLHRKFGNYKRYSGEGSEALIPALHTLIGTASKTFPDENLNLKHVVLGMPHRGRLATLAIIQDYPIRNLVHKIKGGYDIPSEIPFGTDDIATHISVSNTKRFIVGGDASSVHPVTVSTVHNPSHLEI